MNPLLQIEGVTKSYGHITALPDFSLTLRGGEHTALHGRSGCGKSTLFRLIAGLEPADSGRIYIDGSLATDGAKILIPPHRRGLSMVFQDLALWPNLTVRENVELGLSATRLTKSERRSRVSEATELCRISDFADRFPARLSGGQQQRVAVARAVSIRPRLLLLDEPFTGLDSALKCELITDLRTLADRHGITLLAATHDTTEAEALGCHVIKAD